VTCSNHNCPPAVPCGMMDIAEIAGAARAHLEQET
jgi:hypothetical protein